MKKHSIVVTGIALLAAAAFAVLSYSLADAKAKEDYLPSLFLNFVPEAFGIAAGILGTLYVAARVTASKFAVFAPKVFDLLAQLRHDKTITPKATQKAMTAVVYFLDDSVVPPRVGDGYNAGNPKPCRICSLMSKFHKDRGIQKCMTCGLRIEYWRGESKSDE